MSKPGIQNDPIYRGAFDAVSAHLGAPVIVAAYAAATEAHAEPLRLKPTKRVRKAATKAVKAAPVAKASKPKPAKRAAAKGQKRGPADLAALTTKLRGAIVAAPDRGIEAIAKEIGVASRDLALPIKKLLEAKQITRTGAKRATKYHGPKASKAKTNGVAAKAPEAEATAPAN